MLIGDTLKIIRKNKGMTRPYVAKNIMSKSYYYKVENNINSITLEKFVNVIDKLNISLDEFFFIHNNYSLSVKSQISQKIVDLYHQENNRKPYDSLLIKCKSLYAENGDIYYYHTSVLISAILNNFEISVQDNNNIKNYLWEVENYSLYELKLFLNFLFLFDIDTVISLADKMIKDFSKYKYFDKGNNDYIFFIINLINTLNKNNFANKAFKYIAIADKHLENSTDLYCLNALKYHKGISLLLTNKKAEGLAHVETSLYIFKSLNNLLFETYDNDYKYYIETFNLGSSDNPS